MWKKWNGILFGALLLSLGTCPANFSQTCDSLRKSASGESLADAARRNQAWKDCVAKLAVESTRSRKDQEPGGTPDGTEMLRQLKNAEASEKRGTPDVKTATGEQRKLKDVDLTISDVYRRMLAAEWQSKRSLDIYGGTLQIALRPVRSDIDGLVYKLVVRITNTSSEAYAVTYTVKCGSWSRSDRAYIGGSMTLDDSTPFRFGEPSMVHVFDTPCQANEADLEVLPRDIEPYHCIVPDYVNGPDYNRTLGGRAAWERSIGWGKCTR